MTHAFINHDGNNDKLTMAYFLSQFYKQSNKYVHIVQLKIAVMHTKSAISNFNFS